MLAVLQKYLNNSDAALGLGVVFVLGLIIIPLPGVVLDSLIAVSLVIAILILLTAMASGNPAEFSVFPTLLLVTTIYRIAINVSTTRLILSEGSKADSAMIRAFGSFVVGGSDSAGSIAVGIIIFMILTLVQFLVITKGATRVSEVAARFALDSMPGKQLAIDTDQAAGHISEGEARRRRELLQREMGFYGAMDGASKFVQGDVRLGLVMVAINSIGGMIVGTTIHGESMSEAFATYVRFTIGDGLVSTIPALLISTATGVIVTRSVSEGGLVDELKGQLFASPRILYVVGATMILASLIPGFPTFAMLSTGGLLIYLGTRIEKAIEDKTLEQKSQEDKEATEKGPETHFDSLKTETLGLELGYNLLQIVSPESKGTLLDKIAALRRRFAMEMGLIVPPVRIRDNMNLKSNEYVIKIHGITVGNAFLEPDKLMALDTGHVTNPIGDLPSFKEPTFNMTAYWIEPEQKTEIEAAGYDIVDCSTIVATHLSNLIQEHASEIMGRQEVKNIIEAIQEDSPVVVDELLNQKQVSIGAVQAVLQGLLKENVSIRNMTKILEAISDALPSKDVSAEANINMLIEAVRQALHRQIVAEYVNEDHVLECITIDPRIDRRLREAIRPDPETGEKIVGLRPDHYEEIEAALLEEYRKAMQAKKFPVYLCSRAIRSALVYILERQLSTRKFAVIANEEIPKGVRLQSIGMVAPPQTEQAGVAAQNG